MQTWTYILLLAAQCLPLAASLQTTFSRGAHDKVWLLNDQQMEFEPQAVAPDVYPVNNPMEFWATNGSVCDADGQLQAFSNGIDIFGPNYYYMMNGQGLNDDALSVHYSNFGYPWPQMMLMLPSPGSDHRYVAFHTAARRLESPDQFAHFYHFYKLFYSEFDMHANQGQGRVTSKNNALVEALLDGGKITAVRHANGRDWWVVCPGYHNNVYHRFLLQPDSIVNIGEQLIGPEIATGVGQQQFSPDGNKYARYNAVNLFDPQEILIMDFDRCNGAFSNPVYLPFRDTALFGGLAFSENSRFLYVSSFRFLYQYDLAADDIAASRVVVGDPWGGSAFAYNQAQLAPNGKIYLSTQSAIDSLHVIHHPNRKGHACGFEHLGLPLPAINYRTLPNFPYYGLGPLDGSPCDTLGIDNPAPLAHFEYTHTGWQVDFFDDSRYASSWNWTFGDGNSSGQTHPSHTFAGPGPWQVCLTAANAGGSHTFCQQLYLGLSATTQAKPAGALAVYPNPAFDRLYVQLPAPGGYGQLRLLDAQGRSLRTADLQPADRELSLDVSGLPVGLYLLVWTNTQGQSLTQKVVVTR